MQQYGLNSINPGSCFIAWAIRLRSYSYRRSKAQELLDTTSDCAGISGNRSMAASLTCPKLPRSVTASVATANRSRSATSKDVNPGSFVYSRLAPSSRSPRTSADTCCRAGARTRFCRRTRISTRPALRDSCRGRLASSERLPRLTAIPRLEEQTTLGRSNRAHTGSPWQVDRDSASRLLAQQWPTNLRSPDLKLPGRRWRAESMPRKPSAPPAAYRALLGAYRRHGHYSAIRRN